MAVGDKCPSPDSSNGRYRSLLHTSGRGSPVGLGPESPRCKALCQLFLLPPLLPLGHPPNWAKPCTPHKSLRTQSLFGSKVFAEPAPALRTWAGAVLALREASQSLHWQRTSQPLPETTDNAATSPQNCPCCSEAHPEAAPPPGPDASDTGTADISPSWPRSAANLDPPRPSVCPSHHHRNRTPR